MGGQPWADRLSDPTYGERLAAARRIVDGVDGLEGLEEMLGATGKAAGGKGDRPSCPERRLLGTMRAGPSRRPMSIFIAGAAVVLAAFAAGTTVAVIRQNTKVPVTK